VAFIFAALALGATWFVFRLQRFARQQSEVDAARAVLDAVLHGMVRGLDGREGWGDLYFQTRYVLGSPALKNQESNATRMVTEALGLQQVLEVPTEPLAAVATAIYPSGLLLERTRIAANTALWRVHVFNQLVRQQTSFNRQHLAEVTDDGTSDQRRTALATASARLSVMLHLDGIGTASDPDGWYGQLKDALETNVAHLECRHGFSFWRWFEEPLVLVDFIAVAIFAATWLRYLGA
jgi:hypothetical protein